MVRASHRMVAALVLAALLTVPGVVLAEKPPPSPSTGTVTAVEGNTFTWECNAISWTCIPAKGETTISVTLNGKPSSLDAVNGMSVQVTFTPAGGKRLYATQVTAPAPQ